MKDYESTILERPTLTFGVEGLGAREELLFKSFVRLLDHLTHQRWSYQPAAADQRIDLLVVADGVQPTQCQDANQPPQPVLRLGSTGTNGHGHLSWPLKPGALESELNRLGGQSLTQRGALHVRVLLTGAATGEQTVTDISEDPMRLLKWPPAKLLAGIGRMRLATLLTGKAMKLDELVRRSALPMDLCRAFVLDLQRANLLISPSQPVQPTYQQPAPLQKVAQPGLLDRIRLRLGINSLRRS